MAAVKKKAAAKKSPQDPTTVFVKAAVYRQTIVPIVGLTPLLCDRMTDQAQEAMLLNQEGKKGTGGTVKKLTRDESYRNSMYVIDPDLPDDTVGKYGFPASSFRLAAKEAARSIDGINMTDVFQAFTPLTEMVVLDFSEVRMRLDKVGGKGKQPSAIAVRSEFMDWSCNLEIEHSEYLSLEAILNLLNRAGREIGIGAWRVEHAGLHGKFRVGE